MRNLILLAELIGCVALIVLLGYMLWPLFVAIYIARCVMRFYRMHKRVARSHPIVITLR